MPKKLVFVPLAMAILGFGAVIQWGEQIRSLSCPALAAALGMDIRETTANARMGRSIAGTSPTPQPRELGRQW